MKNNTKDSPDVSLTGISAEDNNMNEKAPPAESDCKMSEQNFDPTCAPPGSIVHALTNPILYDGRIKSAANYLNSDEFKADVEDFKLNGYRPSGFSNLDAKQYSLYPGLYCIGAISSLGKTTFISQLADNLATNGEHVLYFSLEMTHFELYSKALSRQMFLNEYEKNHKKPPLIPPLTAMDIRRGVNRDKPEFVQAVQDYMDRVGNRISVIPTLFSIDVEGIIEITEEYMKAHSGVKPIVIIDYLQIVRASKIGNKKLDTKEAVDHIVRELKCFQSKNKLVVIVVSSLNRQNYLMPVDFESFKESGGIEYTFDVIWGLQFTIMNDELFEKANNTKNKRDAVRLAKDKKPRDVELVCLKNRFGRSGYSARFEYYSTNDTFISKK